MISHCRRIKFTEIVSLKDNGYHCENTPLGDRIRLLVYPTRLLAIHTLYPKVPISRSLARSGLLYLRPRTSLWKRTCPENTSKENARMTKNRKSQSTARSLRVFFFLQVYIMFIISVSVSLWDYSGGRQQLSSISSVENQTIDSNHFFFVTRDTSFSVVI